MSVINLLQIILCKLCGHLQPAFIDGEVHIPKEFLFGDFDYNKWVVEVMNFFQSTLVTNCLGIAEIDLGNGADPSECSAIDASDTIQNFLTENLLSTARDGQMSVVTVMRVQLLFNNYQLVILRKLADDLVFRRKQV